MLSEWSCKILSYHALSDVSLVALWLRLVAAYIFFYCMRTATFHNTTGQAGLLMRERNDTFQLMINAYVGRAYCESIVEFTR
jgi:hypothetical protein